jgi:hypothetical protein
MNAVVLVPLRSLDIEDRQEKMWSVAEFSRFRMVRTGQRDRKLKLL